MSENFEGAWPAAGWTLQDYGTSGGEYLFGKRDCTPQNGSYAAWGVGGGADGSRLACGADYPNNVYSVNVQNSNEPILAVAGRLHGVRNGVELPNSPLSAFNNGGSIVAPLTPNRENFGDTLNFQVPAGSPRTP
jgi:hypothetical protein